MRFAALIAAALISPHANAEQKSDISAEIHAECAPYNAMIAMLAGRNGESLRAAGFQGFNRVELWYAPGGRTWTLIFIKGELACIVSGTGWLRR